MEKVDGVEGVYIHKVFQSNMRLNATNMHGCDLCGSTETMVMRQYDLFWKFSVSY